MGRVGLIPRGGSYEIAANNSFVEMIFLG